MASMVASSDIQITSHKDSALFANADLSGELAGDSVDDVLAATDLAEMSDPFGHDSYRDKKPSSVSDVASVSSSKENTKQDDDADKPAWSELKTKAGKERKRLPLACIACRRKKIRCSGEKPACKHCLRSRIPCVYKVTARKAAPRTDYMTMLDKRLKRMEDRVIKIIPSTDPAKMAGIGRASVKPPAVLPRSAGKKRAADEAFGPDDQWAKPEPAPQTASDHSQLQTDGAEHLPSKEIQEHLAEVFFDCCYGQSYPLLHKPSFMRRLKAGAIPSVLILSICSISARFSTHPQINSEPAFLRGEQWAKPAREIALKHYDEPNITVLTSLMILGLHEFGTCQGGRSWMLAGMAFRMAHSLQLHRELDNDPLGKKKDKAGERSFTDREIRRRAMWACFMMDRFISSGTERPMALNERDIEIQLPVSEFNFYHETAGITETLDGRVLHGEDDTDAVANMGVTAYVVRVIALWGRVIRYVNLGGKKKESHPIWHAESKFFELKRVAENFSHTLPDHLKWSRENLRVHKAENLAAQFLLLHIAHQETVLFLHRFAIPTRPGAAPPADMPKDFVQMAGRAAIDAASKISEAFGEGPTHSLMAPFVGYCAFLSSTVHVWCIFSKNPALEAASKRHLAANVKYLSHLKKYWGIMYHMSDNLRTIYRQFADSTRKGGEVAEDTPVLEYGGWISTFPRGVSQADYQEPAAEERDSAASEAAYSQRSDLQTVEEFFDTLQPPPLPSRRKGRREAKPKAAPQPPRQQALRRHTQDAPVSHAVEEAQWPAAQFARPYAASSPMFIPSQQPRQFRPPSALRARQAQRPHRASFDAAFQQPRLQTDGFAQPMYSQAFVEAHSATVGGFAVSPFSYSADEAYGLGMNMPDMDRQRVFGAHATDPAIANDMWDFGPGGVPADMAQGLTRAEVASGLAGREGVMQDGLGVGDMDDAVESNPSSGNGADLSAGVDGMMGEEPAAPFGMPGGTSAWFMPFNMLPNDVDGFGAEFAPLDGPPSLHAEASGENGSGDGS